jgi:tetratricopeptide (TPR) repeat protein
LPLILSPEVYLIYLWFFFLLFTYLGIYIHEFGHALFGVIVMFPLRRIVIGKGKELLRLKFKNTTFIITQSLSGGSTYVGQVSPTFFKMRHFLFVLGGVLTQALVILLVTIIFNVRFPESGYDIAPAHLFIFANLILIVANMIPFNIKKFGIPVPDDGLGLLKTPFLKKIDLQSIMAEGQTIEGYELMEAKKFQEAEKIFQDCSKCYPMHIEPKIGLSVIFIKQIKLDEAISCLEPELKESKNNIYMHIVYNNLAYAYFLKFDAAAILKADEYSFKALGLNSNLPAIISTRGCLLIERGLVDEGIAFLEKRTKLTRSSDYEIQSPTNYIYLAYGYFLKGDMKRSEQYLKKALLFKLPLDNDDTIVFNRLMGLIRPDNI